jgi:hypothetical protein
MRSFHLVFFFSIERIIMPTVEHKVEHEINLDRIVTNVKHHINKHRTAYWVGSLGVAAGLTYVVVRTRYAAPLDQITKQPFTIINNNITHIPIINLNTGRSGPLSYAVQKVSTGEKWRTQGLASAAEGLTDRALSRYFNHGTPLPNGEDYIRFAATR